MLEVAGNSAVEVRAETGRSLVVGVSDKMVVGGTDNTGNRLHGRAARRILRDFDGLSSDWPWPEAQIEKIQSQNSRIVIVAANAVRLNMQTSEVEHLHEIQAANIRKAKLPIAVLGLGAQAAFGDSPKGDIPKGTLTLLKTMSEHAEAIGVRGEFTADVLKAAGISNVEVLGCQSCFYSLDPNPRIPEMRAPARVSFTRTAPLKEAHLQRLAIANQCDFIGQEEKPETFLSENTNTDEAARLYPHLPRLAAAYGISLEQYAEYIREHFRKFYEVEDWLDHLSASYDFSFGTRLHGNMASLIAGVPALWISHDTRIAEICSYFNLPSISMEEASRLSTIEALHERTDYSLFARTYSDRYEALRSYLEMNDLPHNLASGPKQLSDGQGTVIQIAQNTQYDRYPGVFRAASEYTRLRDTTKPKILSYGCSTGAEAFCLAEKYFPGAEIVGLDVSRSALEKAIAANMHGDRVHFDISTDATLAENGPYDVIFAMSVLCRWPESRDKDDISEMFPFKSFSDWLEKLDAVLKPGGILVIYNANYGFLDAPVSEGYDVIVSPPIRSSGFVKKFNPDGTAIKGAPGTDCIYRKRPEGEADANRNCIVMRNLNGAFLTTLRR